jgi:Ala-tRNA(Pro) deacylase
MALPVEKLRLFLQAHRAAYTHSVHLSPAAGEAASAEQPPVRDVAKIVVIHSEQGYAMLVIQAHRQVDFQEVRHELALQQLRMVTEFELGMLFPDCELAAMPPVGALYDLPVYLDAALAHEHLIAFHAGTHRDFVHMLTAEYLRLVHPVVAHLTRVDAGQGW